MIDGLVWRKHRGRSGVVATISYSNYSLARIEP